MVKLEECPLCNSKIIDIKDGTDTLKHKISKGYKIVQLEGLSYQECTNPSCNEVFFNPNDLKKRRETINRALETDRKERGLLTGSEIKEIREMLGYTQSDMDTLLGVGKNSFARWEVYKVDQNRTTDILLRAIRKYGIDFIKEIEKEQNQDVA